MIIKSTYKQAKSDIDRLVVFATQGLDTDGIEVHVKTTSPEHFPWRGRGGYTKAHRFVKMEQESTHMATVCIASAHCFPLSSFNDWRECLIFGAAHEVMHCIQIREGKKSSEKEANQFAHDRLQAYREKERIE